MRPNILIVDNDLNSWRLLSSALRLFDYNPIWAASGLQAVEAANLHQPQAIILDLGLPGGDGFTALEQIKDDRLLRDIPVITITVSDALQAGNKIRQLGPAGYLRKPVNIEKLMATIQDVLTIKSSVLVQETSR
jgi:CheY-like chemotaxis protein